MTTTEDRGATISPCGLYRYNLWRIWDKDLATMCFMMLNPSTADANEDDATIRRCRDFALREQCGSIYVVNVFAFRSTIPEALITAPDPIGPENWKYQVGFRGCSLLTKPVAAWGAQVRSPLLKKGYDRAWQVALANSSYCFGTTAAGHPRHPLYLKKDVQLVRLRRPSKP